MGNPSAQAIPASHVSSVKCTPGFDGSQTEHVGSYGSTHPAARLMGTPDDVEPGSSCAAYPIASVKRI